jgi:PilZ domain
MLLTDPGPEPIAGDLIDVSRGGCQVRLQRRVDPHTTAQVRLALAGDMMWFPIVTSWVRQDSDGWIVGCIFEPLATPMQDALRKVITELSLT